MNRAFVAASVGLAFAWTTAGAQEHRQLGAHEHGHGTLDIAIDGALVTMELEVPGDDIVGFEHDATTSAETAAVASASAMLGKALEIFKVPGAAGCAVTNAKVALAAEEHHDDDHDAASGNAADLASHAGHKEFRAAYTLTCASPVNLATMDFSYFKVFAGAQRLTVNVITGKGQSSFEVSRETPHLDFGGLV